MEEKKMKHLEFIQSIIARMNTSSFLLKGWAVTIVVALFALDVSKGGACLFKIAFLPVVLFWVLDGYFLYQERLFRDLYDEIRSLKESNIDFSMKRASSVCKFLDALFSKTISLFHGVLLITVTYIFFQLGF